MATLTTAAVTDRVGILLQDPTAIRWPIAERLSYISDACREICSFKPDVFIKTAVHKLDSGTRQSLPSDGVILIDITRNMGVDGLTPGRAPRVVTREILDAQIPNWHASTPSPDVIHYTFDPQNQRSFYVYPPQPKTSQGSLEIAYAGTPSELNDGDLLPVDDTWMPALVNYTLYRCYSKDAEYAANGSLAAAYYQAFTSQIAGRVNAEVAFDINRNSPLVNPNVRIGPGSS